MADAAVDISGMPEPDAIGLTPAAQAPPDPTANMPTPAQLYKSAYGYEPNSPIDLDNFMKNPPHPESWADTASRATGIPRAAAGAALAVPAGVASVAGQLSGATAAALDPTHASEADYLGQGNERGRRWAEKVSKLADYVPATKLGGQSADALLGAPAAAAQSVGEALLKPHMSENAYQTLGEVAQDVGTDLPALGAPGALRAAGRAVKPAARAAGQAAGAVADAFRTDYTPTTPPGPLTPDVGAPVTADTLRAAPNPIPPPEGTAAHAKAAQAAAEPTAAAPTQPSAQAPAAPPAPPAAAGAPSPGDRQRGSVRLFNSPEDEGPKETPTPSKQAERQGHLDALDKLSGGVLPSRRQSALSGDYNATGDDWQMAKVGNKTMQGQLAAENGALHTAMENVHNSTGSLSDNSVDPHTLEERGRVARGAVQAIEKHFDDATDAIYDQAREQSQGRSIPKLQRVSDYLNDDSNFTNDAEIGLQKAAKLRMERLWSTGDPDKGAPPGSVNAAERLREFLNEKGKNPSAMGVAGDLKNHLDMDVAEHGGPGLFEAARAMRRHKYQMLEEPTGIKKLLAPADSQGINHAIPEHKVMDYIAELPREQHEHVMNVLRAGAHLDPEIAERSANAIREIQAHTISRLHDAATNDGGKWNARDFYNATTRYARNAASTFKDRPDIVNNLKTINDAGNTLHMDKSYPGAGAQIERTGAVGHILETGGKVAASLAHDVPVIGRMVGKAIEGGVEGLSGRVGESTRDRQVAQRLVDRNGKQRGSVQVMRNEESPLEGDAAMQNSPMGRLHSGLQKTGLFSHLSDIKADGGYASTHSVLDHMAKVATEQGNAPMVGLLSKIREHVADFPIRPVDTVVKPRNGETYGSGTHGLFDPHTHTIQVKLGPSAAADVHTMSATHALVHEIAHGATQYELQQHPAGPFATEINKVLGEARARAIAAGADATKLYGLTNGKEFVAEALTNPKFQKFLADSEVHAQPTSFVGKAAQGVKNLYDRIAVATAKMLGIERPEQAALLRQTMSITQKGMEAQSARGLAPKGSAAEIASRLTPEQQARLQPNVRLKGDNEFMPGLDDALGGESALKTGKDKDKDKLMHFDHYSNLDTPTATLDPKYYGRGMKGAEARRGGMKTVSLYPAGATPEAELANKTKYRVSVPASKLYDMSKDPEGLRANAPSYSEAEEAVRDAGYAGYHTPDHANPLMRGQARLFGPTPATRADMVKGPASQRGSVQVMKSLDDVVDHAKKLGVKIEAEERPGDDIMLHNIERTTGKKGAGSDALSKLGEYADRNDKTVTLGIPGDLNKPKAQRKLASYYEDHGFERDDPNDTHEHIMTRFPDNQRGGEAAHESALEANSNAGAGSQINVGLHIGNEGEKGFRKMSKQEAQAAVESTGAKVTKTSVLTPEKHGVYEPTAVMSLSRPLSEDEMQHVLAKTKQSAIPQRTDQWDTSMHVAPGHEQVAKEQGWDKFNADYFREHSGQTMTDALVNPNNVHPGATVKDPKRSAYPGIYDDPKEIASRVKVEEESPHLKEIFGTTRKQMHDAVVKMGDVEPKTPMPGMAPKGKGSAHASQVTTPENAERIKSTIEAFKEAHPEAYHGMVGWYHMDPMYQSIKSILGNDEARAANVYHKLNTYTALASPMSSVGPEIVRGTAAATTAAEGKFDQFKKYGGLPANKIPKKATALKDQELGFEGHAFHGTSQVPAMTRFNETGQEANAVKTGAYRRASDAPSRPGSEHQNTVLVGDSHFSRGVGLADVRGAAAYDGSIEGPELKVVHPWYHENVAKPLGIPSTSAQAAQWGALSHETGVETPIGAPKLEIWADQIASAARRAGVEPKEMWRRIVKRLAAQ